MRLRGARCSRRRSTTTGRSRLTRRWRCSPTSGTTVRCSPAARASCRSSTCAWLRPYIWLTSTGSRTWRMCGPNQAACVAHAAIRNRGTSVGSLVHADPAAELPGVLALLGGTVSLASAAERREVGAGEFFLGPLQSATRADELAVEAWFPAPPPRSGTAWLEVSRRHGDYALCGVGALVTLDEDRRIAAARAVCVAVGPAPVTVELTDALAGAPADAAAWSQAAALASAAVEPGDDIHATAAYRRHLAGVLVARAGRAAAAAAREAFG